MQRSLNDGGLSALLHQEQSWVGVLFQTAWCWECRPDIVLNLRLYLLHPEASLHHFVIISWLCFIYIPVCKLFLDTSDKNKNWHQYKWSECISKAYSNDAQCVFVCIMQFPDAYMLFWIFLEFFSIGNNRAQEFRRLSKTCVSWLTLYLVSAIKVLYANNLDPDETPSSPVSHPDRSCLAHSQHFYQELTRIYEVC